MMDEYSLDEVKPTKEAANGGTNVSDKSGLIQDEASEPEKGQSGFLGVSVNMTGSVIGSGILGIAYAISESGIGLGIIIILIFAILLNYTLYKLVTVSVSRNAYTYQAAVEMALGRPGYYALNFAQFTHPFLSCASYSLVFGDMITKVAQRAHGALISGLQNTILTNRYFIIFLCTILFAFPLSLYRNVSKLEKWSFLHLIVDVVVTIFVWIRYFTLRGQIPITENAWVFGKLGFLKGLAIVSHSLICHQNSFLMYRSLKEPTNATWIKITSLTSTVSMSMLLAFGIGGFSTFTGNTQSDLMENYCYDDDFANAVRILFVAVVALIYPIENAVCKEVIENTFFADKKPTPLWRHVVVTAILVFVAMAIAMATNCLGTILEFNGIFAAMPLMLIFPPLIQIRLSDQPLHSRHNVIAIILLVLASFTFVIGLYVVIRNIATGEIQRGCSNTWQAMPYCSGDLNSMPNNNNSTMPNLITPAQNTTWN